jgi:hypothetical protein
VIYPVWAICIDGPLAGLVLELKPTDRDLQITTDGGVCCYRRHSKAHGAKVFLFKFTKSLVI